MAHYAKPEYWEDRYQREPDPFDWYQKYQGVRDCLTQHIKPTDKILNIGCGNSRLTEEMYKEGYTNTTNIDISSTVVKQMQERCKEDCPNAKFMTMDARKLEFGPGSFDVVVDKATLDSLLCGDSSVSNVEAVLGEIYRVLAPTGTYICISYGFPQNRESYFKNGAWNWKLSWEKVAKPTISPSAGVVKDESQDQKNFHYIYILKKQGGMEPARKEAKGGMAEDDETKGDQN